MSFGIATISVDGAPTLAVAGDRGVRPLHDLVPRAPTTLRDLLPEWDAWIDAITAILDDAVEGWLAAEQAVFLPPIPDPPTIYCAGANYYDHVLEMGASPPDKATSDPFHFLLPPAALTGHGQPISLPAGIEQLDWEVELTAVIGRRAERVDVDDALSYVAGYTVANDVSVRDAPLLRDPIFGMRWQVTKGRTGFLPMGPAVVPARFLDDPMDIELSLRVNGEARQQSSTRQMIFSLREQIAFLSSLAPLLPGDVILTGTPAGTAAAHGRYLAPGDRMTAHIQHVGTLENVIVAGS